MLSGEALTVIAMEADAIIREAGAEPADGLSVWQLCGELLGTVPEFVSMRTEAEVVPVNGRFRVFVRRGTRPARARWLVGHELAEWWYIVNGYRGPDIEARCDALGAALVAPAPFVNSLRAELGDNARLLAKRLKTTQSVALLRLGECADQAVALVRRNRSTIIRGPFVEWPIRPSWEPANARRAPGIVRVRITDEPNRFGLRFVG